MMQQRVSLITLGVKKHGPIGRLLRGVGMGTC